MRIASTTPAGELKSPTRIHREVTRLYVVALSLVAVLTLASHFSLEVLIAQQSTSASQVNVAGRQRMLSQRVSLQAVAYTSAAGSAEVEARRTSLVDAADLMAGSQAALLAGDEAQGLPGQPSAQITRLMRPGSSTGLAGRVEEYVETARRLAGTEPTAPAAAVLAQQLLGTQEELLPLLDAVVVQYQHESEASVERLRVVSWLLLAVTMVVLMLEALLIFRPLASRLTTTLRRLLHTRDRLRATYDNAVVGVLTVNEGRVVEANGTVCDMLGMSRSGLIGSVLSTLVAQPDAGQVETLLREAEGGGVARLEVELLTSQDAFVAELSATGAAPPPVHGPWTRQRRTEPSDDPGSGDVVVVVVDITARRQAETQLVRQALHDDLTGLPNRTLLMDRLTHSRLRLVRGGGAVTLLMCDLDGFKTVNDTYGHPVGDRLLTEVSARLVQSVRENDTVARFGGDEFVVLLEDASSSTATNVVAERILAALCAPVQMADITVAVGVSIGVATMTTPQLDCFELLRRADVAMYRSKRAGRGRVTRYEEDPEDGLPASADLGSTGQPATA